VFFDRTNFGRECAEFRPSWGGLPFAQSAAREHTGSTLFSLGPCNVAIPHASTQACKQLVPPLAALPAYQAVDILPVIRKALPQFVPGDNIGAVFHPAITILNAGRIEDTHGDFEYHVEGVTPAVAGVLGSYWIRRASMLAIWRLAKSSVKNHC
jgi:hypothetical protein